MTREAIKNTVQEIFQDVLDNDTLVIDDSMSADMVDGWDSLAHISIITAIERHYKIRFSISEIDAFTCIGDIITAVERQSR
jgi:acyl carrier protein